MTAMYIFLCLVWCCVYRKLLSGSLISSCCRGLVSVIAFVLQSNRPVKSRQRVNIWNMKVFCVSLPSSGLPAGRSWCWQGNARRRVLPAGRGGWSLSTWGFGSSNASGGPMKSRFVPTQTVTLKSANGLVLKQLFDQPIYLFSQEKNYVFTRHGYEYSSVQVLVDDVIPVVFYYLGTWAVLFLATAVGHSWRYMHHGSCQQEK